uniref:Carcinoembryonic antigen-related cell adhesion molecule 6 n=1 Tax=Lygus hesperus TaxID=30085 RepID=A0A0A9XUE1_LYGHE
MSNLLVHLLLLIIELSDGLKLIDVKIDKHVVRGRSTTLECLFDLQGETLYSVKWYKDGHEFYRYVPQELPPAQHFLVPGVHVDLENSTEVQVKLMALELVSSGKYRCEVSAEAPSFQTVSAHGDMQVVALPEQGPTISGGRPRYQVGEHVNLNCTSGPSQPPTHLQWYINGSPANSSHLRGPHTRKDAAGLAVTTLGLEFRVERRHFRKGDLKLKCLASIATVYWNSNEESVEGDRPQRPPALEVKDNLPYPSRADRVLVSTVSSGVYSRCSFVHIISLLIVVLLRS